MADIAAGRPVQPAIGLRLERQQRQHMIDIFQHRARPPGPPRPHRRRDIVDDRNPGILGANAFGDAMGEVRAVDDHKNIRRRFRHRNGGFLDQPEDLRQVPDDGGEPDDRELFDRKQRLQAFARHRAAADALELPPVAKPLAQHLHQIGAEAIAGLFRRDQKYPPLHPGGGARRRHAGKPWMNRPARSAASIMACESAAIVWPAITAMPASPARAAPSMVLAPTAGRSKRKSWPLLGAFTSTPRPDLARIRRSPRSRATRASRPSVPSMSSTPTTWPSMITAACPMSNGLSARSTSRPLAMSAAALWSGATRV